MLKKNLLPILFAALLGNPLVTHCSEGQQEPDSAFNQQGKPEQYKEFVSLLYRIESQGKVAQQKLGKDCDFFVDVFPYIADSGLSKRDRIIHRAMLESSTQRISYGDQILFKLDRKIIDNINRSIKSATEALSEQKK